jgi:hypothetical protein
MSVLGAVTVAKAAGGLVGRHWEAIVLGAIAVVTALLVASLWVGKARWEAKFHEEVAAHEKTRAAHSAAVAAAAEATAAAERAEREKEEAGRQWRAQQDEKDRKTAAEFEAKVAAITARDHARRKQLLDYITRLTHYAGAGAPGTEPGAACGDLGARLAATGPLLERADALAERCAIDYGKVRLAWDSCTAYAEQVRPK